MNTFCFRVKKLETRLEQIQTWLGFPDTYLHSWQELGTGFLHWVIIQTKAKKLPEDQNIRGRFPILWKRYLQDKDLSDTMDWV